MIITSIIVGVTCVIVIIMVAVSSSSVRESVLPLVLGHLQIPDVTLRLTLTRGLAPVSTSQTEAVQLMRQVIALISRSCLGLPGPGCSMI